MLKMLKYGHMIVANTARIGLMKKPQLMNLYWESTQRCNLKCKHCFNDSGERNDPDELTAGEIKKELSKIAQRYDAKNIVFITTGGELFLRGDIFEVISHANELGYKLKLLTEQKRCMPIIKTEAVLFSELQLRLWRGLHYFL